MRISRDVSNILGSDVAGSVGEADRYGPLAPVVAGGWVLDDGAVLLAELRDSYFGERSKFPNTGSYELAVNGRGIPDLDIEETGLERAAVLLRRGVAFAGDALDAAAAVPGKPSILARVSVAPTLMDPDVYTGHTTFVSARFARQVGLGPDTDLPDLQIVMSTDDRRGQA